jgi:hypothetical protein
MVWMTSGVAEFAAEPADGDLDGLGERVGISSQDDGQVNLPGGTGSQRNDDDFAALAGDHQGAMPALGAERPDVRAGCLESQPAGPDAGRHVLLFLLPVLRMRRMNETVTSAATASE